MAYNLILTQLDDLCKKMGSDYKTVWYHQFLILLQGPTLPWSISIENMHFFIHDALKEKVNSVLSILSGEPFMAPTNCGSFLHFFQ